MTQLARSMRVAKITKWSGWRDSNLRRLDPQTEQAQFSSDRIACHRVANVLRENDFDDEDRVKTGHRNQRYLTKKPTSRTSVLPRSVATMAST
jgi:hypothetical protein